MPPFDDKFDENYIVRREKHIRDIFMLRAISRISLIIAIVMTIPAILVPSQGLGFLVFVSIAASLWLCAVFTFGMGRAEAAAERAIQQDHERLLQAYELLANKPKRGSTVRLSDDGELVADEVPAASRSQQDHATHA